MHHRPQLRFPFIYLLSLKTSQWWNIQAVFSVSVWIKKGLKKQQQCPPDATRGLFETSEFNVTIDGGCKQFSVTAAQESTSPDI